MNDTTVYHSESPPPRTTTWTRVPKTVWAAVGALALTTAALGGALVQQHAGNRATAAPAPLALKAQAPVFDGPETTEPKGNAPAGAAQLVAQGGAQKACTSCGTVESVRAVKVKGQSTGVGVVGGALAGGLVGHQFGGGSGKTALTIAGAAGGALAGREVERNMRATTVYDVRVRMHDGSVRTFRQPTAIAAGTAVQVEGKKLRIARAAPTRSG